MQPSLLASGRDDRNSLGHRSWWLALLAVAGLLLGSHAAQAQLSGLKTINPAGTGPNNYPTFAAAFAALNTQGVLVGGGGVSLAVADDATFTESNLILNQVVGASAADPVVIYRNFLGTNAPIINAAPGLSTNIATVASAAGTNRDAIMVLNGADFVFIDGLDLRDPVSNATTTAQMEYGILMVRPSNTDGCNGNTIQNCAITLQKGNTTAASLSAIGIASLPYTRTTVGGTLLSATGASVAGRSSDNTFLSNVIKNVSAGFYLLGLADATSPYTYYDQNNNIGGTAGSATMGNTIENFGSGVASATVYGIRVNFQAAFNVSNNKINNVSSGGAAAVATLYGIFYDVTTQNVNASFNSNNLNLVQGSSNNAYGVYANPGNPGTATGSTTMNGNGVTMTVSNTGTAAFSGQTYGVCNFGATNVVTMNSNNVTLNVNLASTGGYSGVTYGIYNNVPQATALAMNFNTVAVATSLASTGNFTSTTVVGVFNSGGSTGSFAANGNTFGYTRTGAGAAVPSCALTAITNSGTTTGAVNVNNNTWGPATGTAVINTSGSITLVSNSNSSNNITSQNNIWRNLNKNVANGTATGYTNSGFPTGGPQLITGNSYTNIILGGGTSAFTGINIGTAAAQIQTITGNTISNINLTGGTGTLAGMNVNYGSAASVVAGNTISGLTGGGTVTGLSTASFGFTGGTVRDNVVFGLLSSGASSTVSGMSLSSVTGATASWFRNKIYDINSTGATPTVNGMVVASGPNNIYNNLIGLSAPGTTVASGSNAYIGLNISSGTNVNVYYNTIYLAGFSSSATFGSSGIFVGSTVPVVDMRNNIVSNIMSPGNTGGTAGATVAYRRSAANPPTTTNSPTAGANNNNDFFAGTAGTNNLLYAEGTTTLTSPQQALPALKTYLAPREANSVSESPNFLSTTGSAATFLHLNTTTATQLESGGVAITAPLAITTDYDNDTRNASTPDIGADEFAGVPSDLTAPNISYTAPGSTSSTANRTLAVTITDASGLPTGGNAPRLYFRKGTTGGYQFVNATTVSGSSYTFTFDYSLVGGVVATDVVQYYVAAQDNLGNSGSNPVGSTSASPPGVTFTGTPNQYTINPVLAAGNYFVGTSAHVPAATYATLTAAAAAYNANGLNGAVNFVLIDATYAAETYPITFNANGDASATNTLAIKPEAGVSAAFTGSSASALLVFNGADYITLDGSNGGTISGTDLRPSRNITLTNTNTGTTSAVVWGQTTAANDAATNLAVRNLNVLGSGSTATLLGIGFGGSTIGTTSLGTGNNNNTVDNNSVGKVQNGIYSQGASAANKNTGTTISRNDLVQAAPNAVGFNGILLGFDNGATVGQNNIDNIASAGSPDVTGINLGLGPNAVNTTTFTGNEVTNARVTGNKIGVVRNTGTFGAYGIALASAASGTNTVDNNFLTGVYSNGTGGDYGAGIFVGGGTGSTTRVVFNSVSMVSPPVAPTSGSSPNYALAIGGATPVVEVRNNIFYNTAVTPTGKSIAIGLAYASTTGNYANLTSGNNDFFVGSGALFFVGATGGLAGTTTRLTLADWFAETGRDQPATAGGTSLTVDPQFVAPTDLHTTTATLDGKAVSIAGITTDIDGQTRAPGVGAPNGPLPDIGADEFAPLNDVAVTTIVSPAAPIAAGPAPVTVTVTNNGATVLTQVTLSYVLNGGAAVSQTFTGLTTAAGTTVNLTFAANATIVAGANTIVVTSSNPNGFADQNAANDSKTNTFNTALLGAYTINQAAAASASNYVSFATATAALAAGGIAGNVTFSVLNGPYTEQVVVPAYAGSGPAAGVVFNGNGQTLTFAGTATNIYVLALNNANYVSVNNLVVTNTSLVNAGGIGLFGTSSNNILSNNVVSVPITISTSLSGGINIGASATSPTTGSAASNNTVTNNTINGGYYCTTAYGLFATPATGNKFLNNTLLDGYFYQMYMVYQTGVQLIGNDISRPNRLNATLSSAYGLYLSSGIIGARVEKNRIHDMFVQGPANTGSVFSFYAGTAGTVGQPNEWVNNAVYNVGGQGTQYGIYTFGYAYNRFYNNTVSFDDAATSTGTLYAAYNSGAQTGSEWQNNIFSARRPGTGLRYGIYLPTYTGLVSNYNAVVVGTTATSYAGYDGTNRVTLADFTAATGLDANSVSANPNFVSATNPTPQAAALNNVGNPAVAGPGQRVTDDLNNATRSSTPDIGALEFVPIALDAAVTAISPVAPFPATAATVPVTVQNNGANPITSVTLTYSIAGGGTGSQTFSTSIASGASVNLTLTGVNFLPKQANVVTVTSSAPNGGTDQSAGNDAFTATVYPALQGVVSVGATGFDFVTLNAAVDYLNLAGLTGAATLQLQNASYPAANSVVINPILGGSASNTLTIKPAAGVQPILTSNATALYVLGLNGTTYVTVDGSNGGGSPAGTSRDLSLVVGNPGSGTAALWLTNAGGPAATSNTVRNLNLTGGADQSTGTNVTFGILSSGPSLSLTSAGTGNNSNTYTNNAILKARYGLVVVGNATTLNTGTVVSNNLIGPAAFGSNSIGKAGILLNNQSGPTVTGNEVRFVGGPLALTTAAADRVGITLGGDAAFPITAGVVTGATVAANRVHDVVEERAFSAIGILLAATNGASASANRVFNNFVSNVRSNLAAGGALGGIVAAAGNGDQVVFNSLALGGDIDPAGTGAATGSGYGLQIVAGVTNPTVRNNAVLLDFTSNTGTLLHAAVGLPAAYAFGTGNLNFNNYYYPTANTQARTGALGTAFYATLPNWQAAATPQDNASIQFNPLFVDAPNNDLHSSSPNMYGNGVPISGITTDIDGELRDPGNPNIGADEYTVVANDLAVLSLVAPATGTTCYSTAEAVTVRVRNTGLVNADFSTDFLTITVLATLPGGSNTPLSRTLTSNALNGGNPLAPGANLDVTLDAGGTTGTGTLDMSAVGTYSFGLAIAYGPDQNIANDVLSPNPTRTVNAPAVGTVTSNGQAANCNTTASQTLTLSSAANGSVQWQLSTNGGTYADISGANALTYATGALAPASTTTYAYRAQVRCSGNVATSNVFTISVNVPLITASSATPASICAGNTSTLSATGASGTTVKIFAAATGGTALASGTAGAGTISYTTPVLTTPGTTNYYAQASYGSQENVALLTPFGTTGNFVSTGYGLILSVNQATTIASTTIYPVGTGTIVFALYDNAGVELSATPALNVTGTGTATPVTVPLNLTVPAAGAGYRLLVKSFTGLTGLIRDNPLPTGTTYPFTSPSGNFSFTAGWLSGSSSTGAYYFFYNTVVGSECTSSPRTAIPVNVTAPPAFAITPSSPQSVCAGSSVTVANGAGTSSFYDTFVYAASPSGASAGISQGSPGSPAATLTPTVTTTYTITASSSTGGPGSCQATQTLTVTVNPLPGIASLTATPPTVCANNTSTLAAIAGDPTSANYGVALVPYVPFVAPGTGVTTYDASTTPTSGSNDDGSYALPMPFNFGFFGVNQTAGSSLFIGTNGYLTFGAGQTARPSAIPGASVPNAIMGDARDLNLGTGGTITTWVTGTAPNRVLVVSYNNVAKFSAGTPTSNMQLALYESSGIIDIVSVNLASDTHIQGIQDAAGAVAFSSQPVTASTTTAWALVGTTYRYVPGGAGSFSYQWSSASPGAGLPGTTTGSSIVVTPTSTSTYSVVATNTTTNCPGPASTITVTVNTTTTWLGNAASGSKTDWTNPLNWTNCVPNALVSAIVPAVTTPALYPILTTGTATALNLTITGAGTVTLSGGTLDVKGNLATAGPASLTATAGLVSFTGTGTQSIGAASLFNMAVSGAGLKTLAGNLTIANGLNLTGGMLALANSKVTMTGTAAITGFSPTSFVVSNGTGSLCYATVGVGAGATRTTAFFPIGSTPTAYNPSTLTNTGAVDTFCGAVQDNVTNIPAGNAASPGYLRKQWDFTEATIGGSNASLTLQWNAADEAVGFNRSRVDIVHYVGSAWRPTGFTTYSLAAGSNPYSLTRSGYTSFSPFTVQDGSKPLPVELTRFEASREGTDALLSWTTATERNSQGFEVQVSADGRAFRPLGFVAGAGNSNSPRSYGFRDAERGKAGLRYYRLLQRDTDGGSSRSAVRTVAFDKAAASLSAQPNPFVAELTLNVTATTANPETLLTLTDATGRTVLTQRVAVPAGASTLALTNLERLPTGVYLLHLPLDGQPQHVKVVKH